MSGWSAVNETRVWHALSSYTDDILHARPVELLTSFGFDALWRWAPNAAPLITGLGATAIAVRNGRGASLGTLSGVTTVGYAGWKGVMFAMGAKNDVATATYLWVVKRPKWTKQVVDFLDSIAYKISRIPPGPHFDRLFAVVKEGRSAAAPLAATLIDHLAIKDNNNRTTAFVATLEQSFNLIKYTQDDLLIRIKNACNTTQPYGSINSLFQNTAFESITVYTVLSSMKSVWTQDLATLDKQYGLLRDIPIIRDRAANLLYALSEMTMQLIHFDYRLVDTPPPTSHAAYNTMLSLDVLRHEASLLLEDITSNSVVYAEYPFRQPECLWSQEYFNRWDIEDAISTYNSILLVVNTELLVNTMTTGDASYWVQKVAPLQRAIRGFQFNHQLWSSQSPDVDVQLVLGTEYVDLLPDVETNTRATPPQVNYMSKQIAETALKGKGADMPTSVKTLFTMFDDSLSLSLTQARLEMEIPLQQPLFRSAYRNPEEVDAFNNENQRRQISGMDRVAECFSAETREFLRIALERAGSSVDFEMRSAAERYVAICRHATSRIQTINQQISELFRAAIMAEAMRYAQEPRYYDQYVEEGQELAATFMHEFERGNSLVGWLGNVATIRDRLKTDVYPLVEALAVWIVQLYHDTFNYVFEQSLYLSTKFTWTELASAPSWVACSAFLSNIALIAGFLRNCRTKDRNPSERIVHIIQVSKDGDAIERKAAESIAEAIDVLREQKSPPPTPPSVPLRAARTALLSRFVDILRPPRVSWTSILSTLQLTISTPTTLYLPNGTEWKPPSQWTNYRRPRQTSRLSQLLLEVGCVV